MARLELADGRIFTGAHQNGLVPRSFTILRKDLDGMVGRLLSEHTSIRLTKWGIIRKETSYWYSVAETYRIDGFGDAMADLVYNGADRYA